MFVYPALYVSAGDLSARSQRNYLNLIRLEYALLFLASVLSLDFSQERAYYAVCAFIFLISLATLFARNWLKPEQNWYKGRALAESIKTSCWRYCMRAEPFGNADHVAIPRAEFRNHLRDILEANRHIGNHVSADASADEQITESMEATRALTLEARKAFYQEHRIRDQRKWYAGKSGANRRASRWWWLASGAAYLIAIGLVLMRIVHPEWEFWPIEPLIVAASSLIGWTQIKKFNELASSYALTAHEIGIIQSRADEISCENDFSDFVNDAEQAFSREHTQWAARQQS